MSTDVNSIFQIAKAFYQDDDKALEAIYFQGYLEGLWAAPEVSRASTAVATHPKKKPGGPTKKAEPKVWASPEDVPVPKFETYNNYQMGIKEFYPEKKWASMGYGIMPNALSLGQSEKGELLYSITQTFPKANSKL
jgi:hypothetical protein